MKRESFYILAITTIIITFLNILFADEPDVEIPYDKPSSMTLFNPIYHLPPVNQDTTNACWSFSTLSFIESEIHRLTGESIKLAVMFPVYHAFLEKGKYFVKTQGKSRFKPGDLFPTVLKIIQNHGIVPEEAYRGQVEFSGIYNHKALESDIEKLKDEIIAENSWQEEEILARLTKILDLYLGPPPESFKYQGEDYTPLTFAQKFVNLSWDDYILITSFSYAPFYQFIKLDVPDNWLGLRTYFNVPLDDFYRGMKKALSRRYSFAIDGDIGEPGRLGIRDVCFVPNYDIPGSHINQQAREYRFEKKVTTDDHLMHIIGHTNFKGEDWFLVKDSWRDAWEGEFKGYFMYHADYARLKILAYLVHKDAIPEISNKIRE